MSAIPWPEGKRFAFTAFDDPDDTGEASRTRVYPFLADLNLRTTIAVWPIGPLREPNCPGETCGEPEYRKFAQRMQSLGFEIGYHNAAPHSCTREEVARSFELFREYFGTYPAAASNHLLNADALYWGPERFHSGFRRAVYNAATLGRRRGCFSGQVESSPHFWGDLCQRHIRYFRNFVFPEVNTLKAYPNQPYHDPERPYVRAWFCSAEGTNCRSFVGMLSEVNQDRLEEEGGMCIMYAHFGKGYVQGGKLDPEFSRLMTRLSRKNGWFAPTSAVLDHLAAVQGTKTIPPADLARLEWRWLRWKLVNGTT